MSTNTSDPDLSTRPRPDAVAAAAANLELLETEYRARGLWPSYELQARWALVAGAEAGHPTVEYEERGDLYAMPNGSVVLFATGQSAERINDQWFTPSAPRPVDAALSLEGVYPVTILHRGNR